MATSFEKIVIFQEPSVFFVRTANPAGGKGAPTIDKVPVVVLRFPTQAGIVKVVVRLRM